MSYTTVRFHIDKPSGTYSYNDYFDVYFGSNKERCQWYCDSDSSGNKYPLLAVRKNGTNWYAPLGDPSVQGYLEYQPLRVYKNKVLAPNTWMSNNYSPQPHLFGGGVVLVSVYTKILWTQDGTVYLAIVRTIEVTNYARTNNGFYDPVTVSLKVDGGTESSVTVEQGTTSKTGSLSSYEIGTSNPAVYLTTTVNGTTETYTINTTSDCWTTTEKLLSNAPFFYYSYQLIS